MNSKVRLIELFAGVGMQRMAFNRMSIPYEMVGISEIDSHAIKSYIGIHGDTHNFGDIRDIEKLPYADMWTYSFPCTDISVSGKQKGVSEDSGTRSSLLWQVKRLLLKAKENGTLPKHLLMENVKNLISKKFITEFEKFCTFLESLGYTNSYQVLNSKDYGVAQNRERIFMLSSLDGVKFEFPEKTGCSKVLSNYLQEEVDNKYLLKAETLKKILFVNNRYIQYNSFDKSINSQANRIYFEDTYSFTISATGTKGGGKITTSINEMATNASFWKQFRKILGGNVFIDAYKFFTQDSSSINIVGVDYVGGKIQQTSRIRGVNGLSSTIPASSVQDNTKIAYGAAIRGRYNNNGKTVQILELNGYQISNTLTTVQKDAMTIETILSNIIIRYLTPLETWRLMGISDDDFYKAKSAGVSDYQLYKQAGNGIVVDVFCAIIKKLYSE